MKTSRFQFPNNEPIGLAIVLGALLLLRLFGVTMASTDLYYDEAQYWVWSRDLDFGYFSKPGMIAWVIRGATEICGNTESCVRAPAAILHTLTAVVLYHLGKFCYDQRVGILAAVFYALMPAVSLSSSLISTDVPLLLFWSLALLFFMRFRETMAWRDALLFGGACAFGLNAKYAMVFIVPCLLLYCLTTPSQRWILTSKKIWVAGVIAVIGFVPNLIWNFLNTFVTFSHTRDNGNWSGALFHPGKAIEFFGAQFAVLGPVLMVCLIVFLILRVRSNAPDKDRALLYISIPIILGITFQALLSRAHANWAATAYPAAVVVLAAIIIHRRWRFARSATIWLHAILAIPIAIGPALAELFPPNEAWNPYRRLAGWETFIGDVEKVADEHQTTTLVFSRRSHSAAAHYYLRHRDDLKVEALAHYHEANDHFQLKFRWDTSPPALLIASERVIKSVDSGIEAKVLGEIPVTRAVSRALRLPLFLYEKKGKTHD